MAQLRVLTGGESHGKALIGILEGLPSGLQLDLDKINEQLARRQRGYGRGGRMKIENDTVEILSGLRFGKTLGSPLGLLIKNRDWENWKDTMNPWKGSSDPVHIPRPGHADLPGSIKYDHEDVRDTLERASARETAMRVAVGAVLRQLLDEFGIWIGSHVVQIHQVKVKKTFRLMAEKHTGETEKQVRMACAIAESSDFRCSEPKAESEMKEAIDIAKKQGDSLGGILEVAALHVPVGIGSHVAWDRRLDAKIASDMMGIPAIKAVEIGHGIETGSRFGSEVHDAILKEKEEIVHTSNRAGGIEGGISNGEPILVRITMKPIPTLTKPLPSVDLETGKAVEAHKERSDVCAVPAACVVAEAMLSITLARGFCEKYGGDSIKQMRRHFDADQKAG